jgi:hypothetical protein
MAQVIWTTHLRERIKQRGLNPDWVDTAVRFPDEVQQSSTTNSKKHIKTIHGYKIVAAVVRQGSDWIITSAWWNPVYGNSNQSGSKNDNRSFFEKWIYNGIVALEKLITGKK